MTEEVTFGRRAQQSGPDAPFSWEPATRAPPPRGGAPQPLSFTPAPLDDDLKAEWAARRAARPAPLLTLAIIAGLAAIFAGEYWFNVGPARGIAPGVNSLRALGAVSRNLVLGAWEPWRLVTAVLLHFNPAHIIGNAIVLFFAGAILERLVGRAWLGATFVVSGLAGSIATLCFDPAAETCVGASGAIMGVLAAAFICSFHAHATNMRRTIQLACLRVAIPALIPFSSIEGGMQVDYNCHGGGFLAGLVVGYLMRALWPVTQVHPGQQRIAAGIGWGGLALAGLSFLMVALHYPDYAKAGERYASEFPKMNDKTIHTQAFADRTQLLVQIYPHDPRTHFLRSLYLLNTHDVVQAENEARAGLAERDSLAQDFPGLNPELHFLLANILLQEDRPTAAETAAEPWCHTNGVSG